MFDWRHFSLNSHHVSIECIFAASIIYRKKTWIDSKSSAIISCPLLFNRIIDLSTRPFDPKRSLDWWIMRGGFLHDFDVIFWQKLTEIWGHPGKMTIGIINSLSLFFHLIFYWNLAGFSDKLSYFVNSFLLFKKSRPRNRRRLPNNPTCHFHIFICYPCHLLFFRKMI